MPSAKFIRDTLVFPSALAAFACLALTVTGDAIAVAPTLRALPAYQSPVRAEGDDLLMIPGHGFSATDTVVYQSIANTTASLSAPTSVPGSTTASAGVAEVVSLSDVPNSLTVRLPTVMLGSSSYAVWVRNQAGEWSNGIRINDARPLWMSPDFAYATQSIANLPRYLKVIGRNLQPAAGQTTRVRLVGPTTITLNAANDGVATTAVESYVARVSLPSSLATGTYLVEVSRDGTSWVPLTEQSFTVRPDAPSRPQYDVRGYGCEPDDNSDDTGCVGAVISAILNTTTRTGTIYFAAGNWNLNDPATLASTQLPASLRRAYQGITVPRGIDIVGEGAGLTTITRGPNWGTPTSSVATFTLLGDNTVRGINFVDARAYSGTDANFGMLKLGLTFYMADPNNSADPKQTSDIVITQNRFDKPYYAIHDDGLPMDHVFVTYNEIGAYAIGVALGGNGNNLTYPFHLDNSVFAYNTFKPGSWMNFAAKDGVRAAEFGAGRRVDVSHNTLDGGATEFLNHPNDAKGWRAGMFWHMRNNHEMVLVSQNDATCTGDKGSDGEAFAFDGNHNPTGFLSAQTVRAATGTTVTVDGPLRSTFESHTLATATYFNEHWLQVVDGRGGGQVRKISAYSINPDSSITFTVSPAFESVPQASTSKVTLSREYWQIYLVDNRVDHRSSVGGVQLCQKSNPDKAVGGIIGYWSPAVDSTIEGNRQYDTSGIVMDTAYGADGNDAFLAFQSNVEIRGNVIDREYDYNSACSWSGINTQYGASDTPGSPPVGSYGVSVARNTVTQADGLHGGAISFARSWTAGPSPHGWKLFNNVLVFRNSINNLVGAVPPPTTGCNSSMTSRSGIHLDDNMLWNTVLYGNSCNNVTTTLIDAANGTVEVCSPATANSCECLP